jgi:transposase
LTHARILLKADERTGWTDEAIHQAFEVSIATIERVRHRYVLHGLEAAVHRKKLSRPRPRRLDGTHEAHLIALACSQPPTGHGHWTMRLLAEKMVRLEYVEDVSYETVRRTLKKMNLNRG